MVHLRINEEEPNPNPHINFITALPAHEVTEQESARQLLRALAAQVRPLMKTHGFSINSLEEYEHNNVFAGRNWNAGETVELVLRRADRTFLPTFWLMSTFCHELAHIKYMDHGPAFQALWRQLNKEVGTLQEKGYYGDGYWSSGTRLIDSSKVAGDGIEPGDLPEYMCGGAHKRKRPTATKRRSRPSQSSTRQTTRARKPGSRVSLTSFKGEGRTLTSEVIVGYGAGFRKQAKSKRAREERAAAAESRIREIQAQAESPNSGRNLDLSSEDESDDENIKETDMQRQQILLTSDSCQGLQELRSRKILEWFKKDSNAGGFKPHVNPNARGTQRIENVVVSEATTTVKRQEIRATREAPSTKAKSSHIPAPSNGQWTCSVCTLFNEAEHLACSACATPRGEKEWVQTKT